MHTETCAVHDDGPCTCGLDEVIDDLMLDEIVDEKPLAGLIGSRVPLSARPAAPPLRA
jgi:hypothetical protein